MDSATADRPKGMVPLQGRPLIAWQLDAFRAAGIEEVAIVRGYRGEMLSFGATMIDNLRWAETNMVASLASAEEWLAAGSTLISYSDLVYPTEALSGLMQAQDDVALTYDVNWQELWQRRFSDPLSDAETFRADERGYLRAIGSRPATLDEVAGQYMGLLKLTAQGAVALLDCFRALGTADAASMDMTGLLSRMLQAGAAIRAVPYRGWWCEVDSASDLALAEEIVAAATTPEGPAP